MAEMEMQAAKSFTLNGDTELLLICQSCDSNIFLCYQIGCNFKNSVEQHLVEEIKK